MRQDVRAKETLHSEFWLLTPEFCRLVVKAPLVHGAKQIPDYTLANPGRDIHRSKKGWRRSNIVVSLGKMKVECVKYVIWAADLKRAVRFYRDVFGGEVVKESQVMSEVLVRGATIGIHSGGEGKRTWTGLSFQVNDVVEGGREVAAGGGQLKSEPQPEGGEPPHLAMCVDPEGNEFMLTRKRGS